MADNRRWELVHCSGPDHHKLFRRADTRRLAIADCSGRFPEDTDDGVLWVDDREPMTVKGAPSGGLTAFIPLIVERDGRRSRTFSDLGLALAISRETGLGLFLEVDGRRFTLTEVPT